MAEKDADVQKIQELIKIMKDNDLVEIDIQHGDDCISLRRAEPSPPAPYAGPFITSLPPATGSPEALKGLGRETLHAPITETKEDLLEIKSPIVGTFYEGPSPDSDPYVDLGSQIEPQTVVGIIEAMKVMNEIKAEISGTVIEKRVSNGQAVEYGQVLFRVRPE